MKTTPELMGERAGGIWVREVSWTAILHVFDIVGFDEVAKEYLCEKERGWRSRCACRRVLQRLGPYLVVYVHIYIGAAQ